MPSRRARTERALLLLLLGALAPGCGVVALAHDKILGPISPAGRIHPLAVGSEFSVGREGPQARVNGANPFRIFPSEPISHLYRVPRVLFQGLHFYMGFLGRFVAQYHQDKGVPPDDVAIDELLATSPGQRPDAREVLRRLGPPRRWIKRREGSLMVYGADVLRELSISIGVPPGVGSFIPFGVGDVLRFDWSSLSETHPTALFFFDREERLLQVVRSDDVAIPAAENEKASE